MFGVSVPRVARTTIPRIIKNARSVPPISNHSKGIMIIRDMLLSDPM
jgi:hypothetical protein